jgi:hypothetical protein
VLLLRTEFSCERNYVLPSSTEWRPTETIFSMYVELGTLARLQDGRHEPRWVAIHEPRRENLGIHQNE